VCVYVIPGGAGRLIKEQGVFAYTAFFSVFAYIWLIVILRFVTPNIIEVWEGVVTFMMFPLLVWLAYRTDIGKSVFPGCGGTTALPDNVVAIGSDGKPVTSEMIYKTTAELAAKVPDASEEESAEMASALLGAPRSRAFYRVKACKDSTGGPKLHTDARASKAIEKLLNEGVTGTIGNPIGPVAGTIEFKEVAFTVRESDKWAEAVVVRTGGLEQEASVHYATEAGTAGHEDFVHAEGTVHFAEWQSSALIRVWILEDTKVEGDENFSIALSAPSKGAALGHSTKCTITIADNDSPGTLSFESPCIQATEGGKAALYISRIGGASGVISCNWETREVGSAVASLDFTAGGGTIEFGDGETSKKIEVDIVNDGSHEKDETFQVVLSPGPASCTFSADSDGSPDNAIATIIIKNNAELKRGAERLAELLDLNVDNMKLGASTWGEQLTDAFAYEGESFMDVIMWLLSLPWKVLVSFIPPTRFGGGWVCFLSCLVVIGVMTAVIGDLAAHVGCCLGLTPAVTAITFVALGTSLPDTFASMQAAREDKSADNSIGNVTGSNSVNVFFGLGLPWAMAAIYWKLVGADDEWKARYPTFVDEYPNGAFVVYSADLGFSVVVFTCCAITTLSVILVRRYWGDPPGELGGNRRHAFMHAGFLVSLWLLYITLSVLSTEKMITTF